MSKFSAPKVLTYLVAALFLYMPFHLFVRSWASSFTGGLMAWEVGKDFVTLAGLILGLYVFVKEKKYQDRLVFSFLILLGLYAILHLVFLLAPQLDRHAVIMGSLYNGRFFVYLFLGILVARCGDHEVIGKLPRWMLILSTITVVFAFVQYILPKDLMTHFGYSVERGAKPNFFIDDKPQYPRVMSFIRDPNSFGAFLILPITYLWLKLMPARRKRRLLLAGLFVMHVGALFLTFSRGAWLALPISLAVSTFLQYKQAFIRFVKRYAWVLALLIIACGLAFPVVKNNDTIQNVVFHADEKTVLADPNEKRLYLYDLALTGIAHEPAGHGPGTSGLIAISNKHGGLITENYFLQIAFEVGIVGLLVFLALMGMVYVKLHQAQPSPLHRALIGSFWAYIFISLLIHLWSNEAVAMQWWLLAGIAIALPVHRIKRVEISEASGRKAKA